MAGKQHQRTILANVRTSILLDGRLLTSVRVASGFQVGFGAIGGIYASTVFMEKEAPDYRSGLWAVTGAQLYLILSTVLMVLFYWRQNKKADRGEIVLEGLASFRYTY